MQQSADNVTYAVDKLTVPAVAWVCHWLHIALPDLVLLATLVYTILQITVLVRAWAKRHTKETENNDNGSKRRDTR